MLCGAAAGRLLTGIAAAPGDWQPFLAMLTGDFSFWFLQDPARGGSSGDRVFYEYDIVGFFDTTVGCRNWELIILEVRDNRISALHEYWGRPAGHGRRRRSPADRETAPSAMPWAVTWAPGPVS